MLQLLIQVLEHFYLKIFKPHKFLYAVNENYCLEIVVLLKFCKKNDGMS